MPVVPSPSVVRRLLLRSAFAALLVTYGGNVGQQAVARGGNPLDVAGLSSPDPMASLSGPSELIFPEPAGTYEIGALTYHWMAIVRSASPPIQMVVVS